MYILLALSSAFLIISFLASLYFLNSWKTKYQLKEQALCEAQKKLSYHEEMISNFQNELKQLMEKATLYEAEKQERSKVEEKNKCLSTELMEEKSKNSALEVEKKIIIDQQSQYRNQLDDIQKTLKTEFKNMGHEIFNTHTASFKLQSQSGLSEILSPLKSDIDIFKKKLEDSFEKQSREQFSLKTEIANIVKINEEMTSQTHNLTKALKGDFRVQGNWGEIILERILEESGLRSGIDYVMQGTDLGVTHPETDKALKPDVVVNLPDDKHIVIDSKVSLTDYERFCSEENEDAKSRHLKQFLSSVKKHVSDLEGKRYQDSEKLKAPDFVLMFMPIEGAFTLAVQSDPELHRNAWNKKVVIVCPSTLFATLKIVASIWRFELQNRNTREIARVGGTLYDKFCGFFEDMEKIGKTISASQTAYENSIKKLRDGKGSIISQTEKLKMLGAKASKNLKNILPDLSEETDLLEAEQSSNLLLSESEPN